MGKGRVGLGELGGDQVRQGRTSNSNRSCLPSMSPSFPVLLAALACIVAGRSSSLRTGRSIALPLILWCDCYTVPSAAEGGVVSGLSG